MKTTPFTEKHIALGAKMHEFAGYNMPIEYSGIIDEHLTVCNAVGVFDVSHMGEFWVKGPQALAFLQKVTSNNVAALVPGKIQYTCFPNEEGGIVDDLLVYCYEPEKYLLVVNAANIEKDWDWCVSHNTEGAELENSSDNMAQLAVQGPKAILALQKLTDIDLSAIPYYTFTVGRFAGKENVIISNTGYTGAGGFELYFYPDAAEAVWKAVFEAALPTLTIPIPIPMMCGRLTMLSTATGSTAPMKWNTSYWRKGICGSVWTRPSIGTTTGTVSTTSNCCMSPNRLPYAK